MHLKGDIFYADLRNNLGSVQTGVRPVMVVSNNYNNEYSGNVTIIPISSSLNKMIITQVPIEGDDIEQMGLTKQSKLLCEQILTISKTQLMQRIGHANSEIKKEVNKALRIQLAV